MGARGACQVFLRCPLRSLQRLSAQAGSALRQDRRQTYRRDFRTVGAPRRRMVRDRAEGAECSAERNRRAGAEGNSREIIILARRWAELPDLSAGIRHTFRRREPAHSARVPDRFGSHRRSICSDEPSIGLHQRDNARLLETLKRLRDLGNTVIVVEHDEDAIRLADHVLDIGPGAGMHGGHIVAQGTPADIMNNPKSLTGKYLTGELSVAIPERKPPNHRRTIKVVNARGNNLKNVSAEIPLGLFTCVTGVSGGGKSTLLIDTLYRAIARKLNNAS